MKIAESANSLGLDEVAQNEPPHLDLHCLPSRLCILNMILLQYTTDIQSKSSPTCSCICKKNIDPTSATKVVSSAAILLTKWATWTDRLVLITVVVTITAINRTCRNCSITWQ